MLKNHNHVCWTFYKINLAYTPRIMSNEVNVTSTFKPFLFTSNVKNLALGLF